MKRTALVLALLLAVVACQPQGAFCSTPKKVRKPGFIGQLLRRPSLPDSELVLRFVEVNAETVALSVKYLGNHPKVREARRRLTYLEKALARAPAAGPGSLTRVVKGLKNRLVELRLQRADLARRYLRAHPTMRAMDGRIRLYKRLFRIVSARFSRLPPSLWKVHNLVVRRAEARGRLRFLLTRYRAAHPRVAAARAVIVKVNRALGGFRLSFAGPSCVQLLKAYLRAIQRLKGVRLQQPDSSVSAAETDAALDTLVVERATLFAVRGCKPPVGSKRPPGNP